MGYLEWQDIVHRALSSFTPTENKQYVCMCVCLHFY